MYEMLSEGEVLRWQSFYTYRGEIGNLRNCGVKEMVKDG